MTVRDRFWDIICAYRAVIGIVLLVDITLFVLTVFTLVGAEPGTGPFVISVLNTVILTSTLAMAAYVLWQC